MSATGRCPPPKTAQPPSQIIMIATQAMMARPMYEIQKWRFKTRATIVAATPIRATESARPMISTIRCWRAAPATARTLSSDIDTSATTIWMSARRRSLGGGIGVAVVLISRLRRSAMISRASFHTTQSRRMPPASVSPMMARSLVVKTAKTMRSIAAAPMPRMIAFRRTSGGNPAAAMPTTMALSPASTRSMTMTVESAVSSERSSGCIGLVV